MGTTDESALSEDQRRRAIAVRPSDRQLAWHRTEFNAFVHYGPNAFTDRAWGTGREDPDVFDPEQLDADQWVAAAAEAGMEIVTMTAKHHDGFCLWPSRYTDHSVAHSRWRDGDGDVIAEVAAACRRHDRKLGIYLSPADVHEAVVDGGRYGNGSEPRDRTIPLPADRPFADDRTFSYELDDYNAYFLSQLFEVLTEYGPIHQVWFDGAHPEETQGDHQSYQTDAWYDLVRELAPEAVISINGPDVRWCGNEAGRTREAEWSVVPVPPEADSVLDADYELTDPDFPDEELLARAEDFAWYPAETDTTIRPDWFYHSEKEPQFKAEELIDLWYRTVGGNSVLLLNLSPTPEGIVPEEDVELLAAVGEHVRAAFDEDLAADGAVSTAHASAASPPSAVLDADPDTHWQPIEEESTVTVSVELPERRAINRVLVREAIGNTGQRIESIAVDGRTEAAWERLGETATVGYGWIARTEEVDIDAVRVSVADARGRPGIQRIGLFNAPSIESNRPGKLQL